MVKATLAVLVFVVVAALGLATSAKAQDIPVPCLPCEPDPPAGCSQCHTW